MVDKLQDTQSSDQLGASLVKEGILSQPQLQHALQVQLDSFEKKRLGQILVDLGYVDTSQIREVSRKYGLRQPLGELLIECGFLTEEELDSALEMQKPSGKRLGEYLLESNRITEERLARALSLQTDLPYILPNKRLVDQAVFQKFTPAFLRQFNVLPLFKNEDVTTVLVHDPFDKEMLRMLNSLVKGKTEFAIGPKSNIVKVLGEMLEERALISQTGRIATEDNAINTSFQRYDLDKAMSGSISSAQAVSIVDYIMSNAFSQGASDIHIDSMYNKLRVRHRVDGVLIFDTDLPKNVSEAVIRRIKVLSKIEISDASTASDGHIYVKYLDKNIDLRVSIFPTVLGPSITIRSLSKEIGLKNLEDLGMLPRGLTTLKQILDSPAGLILFAGPTGSGKTTSLYACLNYLNHDDLKICTVESPVEYSIEGVAQCQLRSQERDQIGERVKAMLHQDADIIVLGEINDEDSAKTAVVAALTGHKVFSTIHTEDTFGAILRLMDMGMRKYLLTSTGVASIAQRLLRKVCGQCQKPYRPERSLFRHYNLKHFDPDNWEFYRGAGCAACHQNGFLGRTGVFEILTVNEEIRNAFLDNQSASSLRKLAQNTKSYLSLREAGFIKSLQGETTLEDALGILSYSEKQSFGAMELTEEDIKYWMNITGDAEHDKVAL
ncbi:Flp pilus assembly complex ATPase component TadA [Candidatus Sumerlaeota bacterium]|nr:Flp pilus assembly complex ATPase component TadA [Candidatus Sumerlaeota bacterium]